ncbi:transcriptional regulator [Kitasatospora sp. NPDC004669]|uniref:ArsR/SmtB family transcription factor n=1 Tax=Kitasatospora sp. NPDC004669 TaxID=3154555 RepID=UPI0033B507FD
MPQYPAPPIEAVTITGVLFALSDPSRLRIIAELDRLDAESICDHLGGELAKSTRSHHLKTLRTAGLTHTRTQGRYNYVSLRREELDARFPGLLDAVLAHAPVD